MKTVISVIAIFLSLLLTGCTNVESTGETASVMLGVVLSKIKAATRILPREVRIYQDSRKNVSEAVKLAQEGKLKRWYVKTAKGQLMTTALDLPSRRENIFRIINRGHVVRFKDDLFDDYTAVNAALKTDVSIKL